MKSLVVIPAFNEAENIGKVIKGVKNNIKDIDVVVINDGSFDNTKTIAKEVGAKVLSLPFNLGYGVALQAGFKYALKNNYDYVVTIDGDGQHNPEDIKRFVAKIKSGYDFVLGERNLSKYPFFKKFGNFFLQTATNFISGTNLSDTESGFRAFRRDALKKLYLKSERYEIAVEIIFEVGRNNLRAINVPIDVPVYIKGVGVIDGFRNFMFLLHRRERTWRSYLEDIRYVFKKRLTWL